MGGLNFTTIFVNTKPKNYDCNKLSGVNVKTVVVAPRNAISSDLFVSVICSRKQLKLHVFHIELNKS